MFSTTDPGPLTVTFSGLAVSFPTSKLLPGFVSPVSTAIAISFVAISSIVIGIAVLESVILVLSTPGREKPAPT